MLSPPAARVCSCRCHSSLLRSAPCCADCAGHTLTTYRSWTLASTPAGAIRMGSSGAQSTGPRSRWHPLSRSKSTQGVPARPANIQHRRYCIAVELHGGWRCMLAHNVSCGACRPAWPQPSPTNPTPGAQASGPRGAWPVATRVPCYASGLQAGLLQAAGHWSCARRHVCLLPCSEGSCL